MTLRLSLLSSLVICALAAIPARAQVGTVLGAPGTCVRTFYIDFATGSDANNGTAKGTPWQHSPYMTGWTGTYTHAAGDCEIFKGGVTWTNGAMPLYVQAAGSSSHEDYYGVDQTWYTGGAWARPIFDCQSTVGCNVVIHQAGGESYITYDSLELRGAWLAANVNGWTFYSSDGAGNTILNNLYIHNWRMSHTWTNDSAVGGIYFNTDTGSFDGNIVQNTLIDNSDGGYMATGDGSVQTASAGGVAVRSPQDLVFNEIRNVSSFVLHGGRNVHDNFLHDSVSSWDGTYHTNTFYIDSWQNGTITIPEYVYRNRIVNSNANAAELYPSPCYFASQVLTITEYYFDNVVMHSSNYGVDIDANQTGCGNNTANLYFYNNTIQIPSSNLTGCARATPRSGTKINNVIWTNNHCIYDSGGAVDFSNATSSSQTTSIIESNANATTYGYSFVSTGSTLNYAPTNATCNGNSGASTCTISNGTNLNSTCSGSPLSPNLCEDINLVGRPSAWDIGAYQYSSGGGGGGCPCGVPVTSFPYWVKQPLEIWVH